jgi:hypothetical protein
MVDSLSIEDLAMKIELIEVKEDLRDVLSELCILASNERSKEGTIKLLDKAIIKCEQLDDELSLVKLIGYRIPILYNQRENIPYVRKLISKMKSISERKDYRDILAWAYSYIWYIEKFEGNKEESKKAILKAIDIIKNLSDCDEYIHYFIQYSYAIDLWFEYHDVGSSEILEKCAAYYYNFGFYRSLAQTIGLLSIIYLRTQRVEKGLEIIQKIFCSKTFFHKSPYDVKGIVYYFAGLAHMLNTNLYYSELYFKESYNILKAVIDKSIYSSNFVVLHSFLSIVMALQGKIELASEMILKEDISQQEYIIKNLDENTKNQIIHTRNLTKFYVVSRMGNYHPDNFQELIDDIYHGLDNYFSDYIALSEYILNANLNITKLKFLLSIDNFSIKRIKHIVEFKIEKEKIEFETSEEKSISCIKILEKRKKTEKTTFIENVYSDILVAQELFSLKRFAEIYPLLKKYEKQLNRIEVLEMRIYMEAFIQVGKFRNGDPLAPALHFMAIKRCRERKFGRLEGILLDQQKTLQKIALNALNY